MGPDLKKIRLWGCVPAMITMITTVELHVMTTSLIRPPCYYDHCFSPRTLTISVLPTNITTPLLAGALLTLTSHREPTLIALAAASSCRSFSFSSSISSGVFSLNWPNLFLCLKALTESV